MSGGGKERREGRKTHSPLDLVLEVGADRLVLRRVDDLERSRQAGEEQEEEEEVAKHAVRVDRTGSVLGFRVVWCLWLDMLVLGMLGAELRTRLRRVRAVVVGCCGVDSVLSVWSCEWGRASVDETATPCHAETEEERSGEVERSCCRV